ncbi:hypothetical protein FHS18_001505 [Paenibacillus phyllosphaerae]|uniref:YlzJ-like protein n=1 Tax=Paenibacillus phyllosphaerae TaxID=274593 RepID=A0A7W5FLV4_9BACL|nr:YlzJ-like family protein [Paenibacillus phyllosphaerae]MBB3109453.1 hypothetical protein [Paenibacillus phyllosphaerae]
MTLYTSMPLELVLDGVNTQPGPFVDVVHGGVKMQVEPVSPGIGRIVRLLECPLDAYLDPQYAPGTIVTYASTVG